MPDRNDPPPQATVKQAAADGDLSRASAQSAETSRESYHQKDGGADPGGRALGRKDPATTGETDPDKENVPVR